MASLDSAKLIIKTVITEPKIWIALILLIAIISMFIAEILLFGAVIQEKHIDICNRVTNAAIALNATIPAECKNVVAL